MPLNLLPPRSASWTCGCRHPERTCPGRQKADGKQVRQRACRSGKAGRSLKKSAEELKGPKASDEKKLAFIRKKQELDQKTRNFLRKVEQDEVKLRQDMVTMVFNATYNVAQKKGFNFVVDITAGGVLYARPDHGPDPGRAGRSQPSPQGRQGQGQQVSAPTAGSRAPCPQGAFFCPPAGSRPPCLAPGIGLNCAIIPIKGVFHVGRYAYHHGHPAHPLHPAPPLSFPAGGPRAGMRAWLPYQGLQERDHQRALLPGPFPGCAHHARRAHP